VERKKPVVGVLMTLLELYRKTDPERPSTLHDHWKPVMEEALSPVAELHFTGVSHTAGEIAKAVSSCEHAACDLLLVLPLAYAPSGAAEEALCGAELPLLVVSSARDATLPYDMSGDHIMANHAMHGVQDLANVLARKGRNFELLAGHPSDAAFRQRLIRAVRAAAGARVFRKGWVGRIGEPFEDMLDFDPGPHLAEHFGLRTVSIDPDELARVAESVTDERISELAEWARSEFDVDDALTPDILNTSARWSLALEDLVRSGELDAVSMNFLAVAAAGADTMPFLGASRLMARGVGYAGEGDILTAALVAALARMADGATFTEMFCPDYERSEVLLSHMGECNFALANPERPVKLAAKDFAFGECEKPAVPVFQLKPGAVTLASITQWPGEGFRVVACTGEVAEAPEHPGLSSPYSRIRFGRELPGFLEDYSRAGGTHHLALGYGDLLDELRAFARFLNISCRVV